MRNLLLFIGLISHLILYGQVAFTDNSWLSIHSGTGFVIPEYSNITHSVTDPIQSIHLSWNKRTTGKRLTEQLYHFPEYGISAGFSTLGNSYVFGHELSLYPYFRTFFYRGEHSAFFHQFGFGLGYASKKFDITTNPDNISVGSHLNMHFDYQLGYRLNLKKNWGLEAAIRFAHFSNANMAEPNLGLNLLYINAGVTRSIGNQEPTLIQEIPRNIKRHEMAVIYAMGGKHTRALQSTIYFTSSASIEYKYHAFHKYHFGAGMDLFYDSATETELSIKPNATYEPKDAFSSGIHLSQEIVFGDFSFILQEGLHIGLKDKVHTSPMYNRAILRWKCTEHLLVHISMKSHLHILDYPEIGFGYHLKSRP
ncbi:MAG: acyloxyacyl hydrolase [Flavobacteriales bacterium]